MSWLKLTSGMILFVALTAPVFGQTSEPGTHDGMMGQRDLRAEVEGRLAYVKTALGITDNEAAAWKAYEDAARANVQSIQSAGEAMVAATQSGTGVDRLQKRIALTQTELDALKALQPATEALYKALTPEQQKKADTLLGRQICK